MSRKKRYIVAGLLVVLVASAIFAQRNGRFRNRSFDPTGIDRQGLPVWETDPQFKDDMFTFVRIRYTSYGRGGWAVDYPGGDLNLSFRLQQLTSLKVNPHPIVLDLTDEQLFDYPFIYMLEVGSLVFGEDEIVALRRYLNNGGFLMVDDFWGQDEWDNFYREIKRVFPTRDLVELPMDHAVFNSVFKLKEKPQIPNAPFANAYRDQGITWERYDAREVHIKGIFDDNGRMMVIICHNTDLGDGWEREGDNEWYFREFSEKKAYPLGINIIFYAMTH